MPHLRFTRDKRGYENTYVVHSERRRGKARQRILYWFRTPPNIRVGRVALDENAIRAIEECNPDIVFDWSEILEAQPPPTPPDTPDRRRKPRDSQPQGRPSRPQQPGPRPAPPAPGVRVIEERRDGQAVVPEAPRVEVPAASAAISADGLSADVEVAGLEEPPALVPVTVYHGGADVYVTDASDVPRQSKVEAQLGSEQLGRVRARYSEMLARITERVGGDAARLEEMRRAAEALNPDSWVTEAEITSGLQQFDARLGEIRRALGIKRRRRSRRGGRRRRRTGEAPRGVAAAAGTPAPPLAPADAFDEVDELNNDGTGLAEDEDDPTD